MYVPIHVYYIICTQALQMNRYFIIVNSKYGRLATNYLSTSIKKIKNVFVIILLIIGNNHNHA